MAAKNTIAGLFLTGIVALTAIACTSSKDPTPAPSPTSPTSTSTAAVGSDGGAHADAGPVVTEPPSGW